MPASINSDDRDAQKRAVINSDNEGGDRIIDGLRYPRQERHIDRLGFEETSHGLHFRGRDWDIPLTRRRDELTKAFQQDAAAATREPEGNICSIRFIVSSTHLSAKLTVRHKAHVERHEVQRMLATAKWTRVKALYEPRQVMPRSKRSANAQGKPARGIDEDDAMLSNFRQTTSHNLSFFGRANVGAEGPEFADHANDGEEPAPYEDQQNARTKRTTSHMFISVGLAV